MTTPKNIAVARDETGVLGHFSPVCRGRLN